MAVKVGVGVFVAVGVGAGVFVGIGDGVDVGIGDGVNVAVGNALAVGGRLGAGDGVAVGAGVFVGTGVGGIGDGVDVAVGNTLAVGSGLGGAGVFVGGMGVGVLAGGAALGVATARGAENGVGDSSDVRMQAATIAPAKMTTATKKRGAFKIRSLPFCRPMIRGNETRAPATSRLHFPKAVRKPAAYGLVSKTSAFRTRSAYSIPPQFVRFPTTPAK